MELSPLTELPWRTSSHSGAEANSCVEVAPAGTRVGVRDTKDRTRGAHLVPAAAWRAFLTAIRHDRI